MGILEERRKRRIANLLRQQQDMAKYNQNKNSLLDAGKQAYEISGNVNQIGEGVNKLGKNFGNDKLANVGSKIQNISGRPALNNAKATLAKNLGLSSGVGSAGTAGASMAGTTGVGGSAIANGIASAVPSATSAGLASGAGATGLAGAGATTAGTAGSALGSSALGSSLLGATGGASVGAMGTAGATSALSGATAGATAAGAGAGAGMGAGAAALGAAGPIGAALLAGYAIYNMVKSAKAKKNAKAMAKEEKKLANFNQEVAQNKAEMQNTFAQGAQNNLAQLDNEAQTQLDPTGSMNEDIQEAQNQGDIGQYSVGYNPNEFNARDRFKWDMMNNLPGAPSGAVANTNQGYIGELPKLGAETPTQGLGQYGAGNIDLYSRPKVANEDGSISTVRSMSFNDGNNEVLIPTVSDDGKILSPEEAIANYDKTGKFLGKFGTVDEANAYADQLHNEQDAYYNGATGGASGVEEDKPGIVSKIMDAVTGMKNKKGVEGELPKLQKKTPVWDENTLNAMDKAKGLGLDQSAVDGVAQGLNGGNKDVAGIVDEFGIRKPSTEEEIALAREGKFNTPTVPEVTEEVTEEPSLKDRIKNKFVSGVKDLKAGFDDNVSTSLAEGDLLNNIVGEEGVPTSGGDAVKKGIMNRVGELAGTTVRTLGKPAVQGLIATGISRAQGNDWGKSIETGLDYAQKRQVADHYYKALNPEAKFTPLFSGLGAEDYKAHTMNEYRDAMVENTKLKTQAQLDKSNPTIETYLRSKYLLGELTPEQYQAELKRFEGLLGERVNNSSISNMIKSKQADNMNAHYQRMDELKAQAQQIDAQYKQGMLSKYERDQQLKVIDQQLKSTEIQIKALAEQRQQYETSQEYEGYTPNANILTGNTTGKTVTVRAGGQTRNIPADQLKKFKEKAEANGYKVEVI